MSTFLKARRLEIAFVAFALFTVIYTAVGFAAEHDAAKDVGLIGSFMQFLAKNPFLIIMISLAFGYPVGQFKIGPVTLGSTAGTLLVGIILCNIAFLGYDVRFSIPGIVSTISLALFMYAIGLKVGPAFFSGLARDGLHLVVIAVIVVVFNWLIAQGGAMLLDMAPGYGPGMISGSFTVTAVLGVAQSAIDSGSWVPPEGFDPAQAGANMAAGYAISYILSSLGIILMIKYLPAMFGHDPVAEGKKAEEVYGGGGDSAALPGTDESFIMGYSPTDIRAYKVTNQQFIGMKPMDLFKKYQVPVLRVVRKGEWMDVEDNKPLEKDDVITVRADVERHIEGGAKIGPEVSDELSRRIDMEVAEIVIGNSEFAGKTLRQIGKKLGYGLYLQSLFRAGEELPHLPNTKLEVGDVARVVGPPWCVDLASKELGSVVRASATTEVMWMAIALVIGYSVGKLSVTIGQIPFALGTSAGIILTGILVSAYRARNPLFGGPVNEGARALLQDLGLNLFIAVLAANVGSKIINSFAGGAGLKIAIIGTLAALLPAFIAWLYGYYIAKMNPVVLGGACAGGRNSTPAMRGLQDESKSVTPAIGYPVPYAVSTILVLIGGYIAMVIS